MLEATYGITVGSVHIDASSKIVDQVPQSAVAEESIVEYGYGRCTAAECTMTSALPCMVCKYFITTLGHEPFFVKAIENTDHMISISRTPHDKEDLVIIKDLYGAFLEAIYRKKEQIV